MKEKKPSWKEDEVVGGPGKENLASTPVRTKIKKFPVGYHLLHLSAKKIFVFFLKNDKNYYFLKKFRLACWIFLAFFKKRDYFCKKK